MAEPSRIDAQLAFLNEVDKLKDQLRATPILSNTRPENSAEHSWHIMLYALVLAEHANRPIRIERVLKMLLLHDIVEIDAGDAPIHGDHDPAEQEAKEIAAAERIFGLLPADQRDAYRALWDEFEAAESDDAIFAKSIDRVQPVISNLETGGGSWIDYNVTAAQLESRVGVKVRRGAPAVWEALKARIDSWFAAHR
ncbi:MAG TPA: HD domain-containing protein [Paracoccaceae bacterium]|nr:HD domain-containing protein [Paracoccaceae bacterium]